MTVGRLIACVGVAVVAGCAGTTGTGNSGSSPVPRPASPVAVDVPVAVPEPTGAAAAPTQADAPAPTEKHVEVVDRKLRQHQAPDGSWPCRNFAGLCRKGKTPCDGPGATDDDTPATTSLMTLALLGAGHSLRAGRYKDSVRDGLAWLRARIGADGGITPRFPDGRHLSHQALMTFALCEAANLSAPKGEDLRADAERAVTWLLAQHTPGSGWRLTAEAASADTGLTIWSTIALVAARDAGIAVPPAAFEGALAHFRAVEDPLSGAIGYRVRGDLARPADARWVGLPESLVAGVCFCRLLCGVPLDDPAIRRAAERLRAHPPAWEPAEQRDFIGWYWGTHAMFRLGGEDWRAWNAAMKDALIKTQVRGGCADGTWDPVDAWGPEGGRLYALAINILSLEVYFRYGKVLSGGTRAMASGK